MLDIMYDVPSRTRHQGGRRQRGRHRQARAAAHRLHEGSRARVSPRPPSSGPRQGPARSGVDGRRWNRGLEREPRFGFNGRERAMFFKNDGERGKGGGAGRRPRCCPLRDIIVFPHMVSQLFVGRERSIAALDEAMSRDKEIFLAAQKQRQDQRSDAGGHLLGRLGRRDHAAAPPARRHREGARRGQAPARRSAASSQTDAFFLVEVRRDRRERAADGRRGRGADALACRARSRCT